MIKPEAIAAGELVQLEFLNGQTGERHFAFAMSPSEAEAYARDILEAARVASKRERANVWTLVPETGSVLGPALHRVGDLLGRCTIVGVNTPVFYDGEFAEVRLNVSLSLK